ILIKYLSTETNGDKRTTHPAILLSSEEEEQEGRFSRWYSHLNLSLEAPVSVLDTPHVRQGNCPLRPDFFMTYPEQCNPTTMVSSQLADACCPANMSAPEMPVSQLSAIWVLVRPIPESASFVDLSDSFV
ncbi:unnamed protein product, partial [Protopolystoma xenopodis]